MLSSVAEVVAEVAPAVIGDLSAQNPDILRSFECDYRLPTIVDTLDSNSHPSGGVIDVDLLAATAS
jgi:hypothetical protein